MTKRMGFIGVSTASSSINKVFPRWAEKLGLPARQLVGHDVPLDAPDDTYRKLVTQIAADADYAGALVTTHKIRMFEAAADLFAELDTFARACGEISSISKQNGALVAHAKDPLTVGMALSDFLPGDHFSEHGGHVLVFGAGGSGTALAWHLADRSDQPDQVIVTDTSAARLRHLEQVLAADGRGKTVTTTRVANPEESAALVAQLPANSLVVNATGLGKDRPGSPIPDGTPFPRGSYAWEFNYRGSLEFLRQAQARRDLDALTVVDGWRYFIHGWSQVVAEVFHLELDAETVERLAQLAEEAR